MLVVYILYGLLRVKIFFVTSFTNRSLLLVLAFVSLSGIPFFDFYSILFDGTAFSVSIFLFFSN